MTALKSEKQKRQESRSQSLEGQVVQGLQEGPLESDGLRFKSKLCLPISSWATFLSPKFLICE